MLDWGKYIAVADKFQHKAKHQDREDLSHTIILSLAQAQIRLDNNGGYQLSDVAMLRVASYTVADYWRTQYKLTNGLDCGSCSKAQRQKCRQDDLYSECPKAIKLEYLSKPIIDSEGNITELGQTLADDKAIDLAQWLDDKTFLLGCPKRLIVVAGKRLKVICGANTSYLADGDWIGEKTPLTLCDVRVSPNNSVKPNVGGSELADALARVLPFTAKDDARPIFQCVNFVAKDGKLTLVSADGFRLAIIALDYDDGEGQALINRDELKGIINALKRAKRARVSFEAGGETLDAVSLVIDTELIRYKWASVNGNYPDYEKLIPTDFNCFASFDTVDAIKAVNSLKAISDSKAYPIDLTIGDGKLVMANPDNKGQAELVADTDGQGFMRIDGQYLADALKACGGMVDFKLTNAYSPMLFTVDGYQLVVMPMLTDKATEQQKADRVPEAVAEPEAEAVTEPEASQPEPAEKPKRSRAKQPVKA